MTAENASVRAIRARLEAEYDEGVDEGYSAHPNALPEFLYKPYVSFTARQRGWVFGYGLARYEWGESHLIDARRHK